MSRKHRELYESFINGNKRHVVEMMGDQVEAADFLQDVEMEYGSSKALQIAMAYFRIKGK